MQIVIDIPDEQIKKSLKESEYVLEDEGIKGFVNIAMLYTNGRLKGVRIFTVAISHHFRKDMEELQIWMRQSSALRK